MLNIENITQNITNIICKELNLDDTKKEILNYGAFALVHALISIILTIILGMLFNVLIEALILSFSISILRKFSGGVHASTPNNCIILGNFVFLGFSLLSNLFIKENFILNNLFFINCLGFLWCSYIIFKLAPVDNPNKPLTNKNKNLALKKKSFVTILIYEILILVMISCFKNDFQKYPLALLLGMLWQCFTLSKPCFKLVTTLDSFLNKLN